MSTHIAAEKGDIASTVLLPGDPLRATWIAQNYLSNARIYSQTRGMLGYTGTYDGREVSVQPTGMGQPSMAIYAHELFADFGVQNAIRIGTCGSISPSLELHDVVIALSASTDSSLNPLRAHHIGYAPTADYRLLQSAVSVAKGFGTPVRVGPIASLDAFYDEDVESRKKLAALGVLAVEMECAALYITAAKHQRAALTITTVSDHILRDGPDLTAEERETSLATMVEIALSVGAGTEDYEPENHTEEPGSHK